MILYLFSVHDAATGAYLPPIFMRSKGEAIRSFTESLENEQHQFHKHYMDYTLFALGTFDDNSGIVTPAEPVRVISGVEAVGPKDSVVRPS